MPYTPLDRPGSIPEAFVEAWNARDPAAPAAIFDEDAEFVNVTGRWWHGRATIEKVHAYALQHIFSDSTLAVVRLDAQSLS